uniref:Uncharacterized protein n=1 Tax=Arundo donax TaxID=35708 RepID=A0A0A8YZI7_ARUDO
MSRPEFAWTCQTLVVIQILANFKGMDKFCLVKKLGQEPNRPDVRA